MPERRSSRDRSVAAGPVSPLAANLQALQGEGRSKKRRAMELQPAQDRRSHDRSMQALLESAALALGFNYGVFMQHDGERSRVMAGFGVESLRTSELMELCDVPVRLMRLVHAPDPVRHTELSNMALVQHQKGLRFFCGIPLFGPGMRVLGTLALFDFKGRRLSQQQLTVFQGVARAMEELLSLRLRSVYDDLTGLYNREHFDLEVARECRRAQRANEPLSLLVLDLDQFALFNQTRGRLAGTEALKRVGEMLATRFSRAGDVLARYRGDEFVLALAKYGEPQAEATARRMQRAVRSLALRFRGSPEGVLTASIGIICARPETLVSDDSARQLLSSAYTALQTGRNLGSEQIVTHNDSADVAHSIRWSVGTDGS